MIKIDFIEIIQQKLCIATPCICLHTKHRAKLPTEAPHFSQGRSDSELFLVRMGTVPGMDLDFLMRGVG